MPEPDMPLAGQCLLVVGGGRGLGRQYCLDAARAGAKVIVAGRSQTAAEVAREIQLAGGEAAAVLADARDGVAVISKALQLYGRIDAMIVNAGIVRDRSFSKMSECEWSEVIDTHLGGAFACAKAAWEPMRAQRRGSIVFTTSGAGFHGAFGQANYAAAKAGVIGLTRALAIEGKRYNIRVNAIAPMASTQMTQGVFSPSLKDVLTVEAVSPFALALAARQSSLTGQIIEAGGGWAAAMRWERSRGMRIAVPNIADAINSLPAIVDFTAEGDHPTTTADCLDAAMGYRHYTDHAEELRL